MPTQNDTLRARRNEPKRDHAARVIRASAALSGNQCLLKCAMRPAVITVFLLGSLSVDWFSNQLPGPRTRYAERPHLFQATLPTDKHRTNEIRSRVVNRFNSPTH